MNIQLQLFGIEETIIRPMVIRTLKDIAREIGCQTEPYLYLDQNSTIVKTRNRNKSKPIVDENSPIRKYAGKYTEFLRINSITDNLTPGYEIDYRISTPCTKPFFNDKEIGFNVSSVIQERKIDFTIEYTTTDNAYLNGIINTLRILPTLTDCKFLHNLEYTLQIPNNIKKLIGLIYKKKRNRWSKEETLLFSDYMLSISDDRLTILKSPDGSIDTLEIAIKEKLLECLGVLNTDVHNLKIEETDYGYTIELDYSIYIQVPIAFNVNYPLMVYNQLIKKSEMNIRKRTGRALNTNYIHNDLHGLRRDFYNDAFSDFYGSVRDYIKFPVNDDTMPHTYPDRYIRLFTNLFEVGMEDRCEIFNLSDISCVDFKPYVKDFILQSEYKHITRKDQSYLYLAIYENDLLLDNKLTMDEKGNIRTTFEMDIKKTYRLVLFLLKDLDFLTQINKDRISKFLQNNLEYSRNFQTNELRKLVQTHGSETHINTQILTIKNKYLSTLDVFKNIYGLSDEDVEKVIKRYGHGVDVGDIVKYSNIKKPKVKQIFHSALQHLFL